MQQDQLESEDTLLGKAHVRTMSPVRQTFVFVELWKSTERRQLFIHIDMFYMYVNVINYVCIATQSNTSFIITADPNFVSQLFKEKSRAR